MMGCSKSLIEEVFRRVKVSGGSLKASVTGKAEKVGNRTLLYRSYDPALAKEDFLMLIPQLQLSCKDGIGSLLNFNVWKVRDARYFMFRDKYMIQFSTAVDVNAYLRLTEKTSLDDRRVQFEKQIPKRVLSDYQKYQAVLRAAYESQEAYSSRLREVEKSTVVGGDIMNTVAEIESKSVLVWNLPMEYKPLDIMNNYRWYDIRNCFKMFWDAETERNLTYMSFYDAESAEKFKLRLHGSYVDGRKLLVERL